ncbi:MAG TPA: hypothetical protein DDZ96_14965 [Porphyromonadaceae bacterium]|jgi:hypothetical protein|nr:hypothetical protein [Porphyromonadaceae bacterium]HBX19278.1 hypothetical protein [Porphyromonadaceae bacterium]HCM20447.1 hypothetical protein [Porphyromonadaceae bacterium]
MNTLIETIKYFLFISAELLVLFMLISMIVEIILMYIPAEKIQKKLSGKGITGNILGAVFGSLTPFCACSTIPMTVGLLNAGVPFGSTMSFLIASPLLNPIIIGMLGVMVGVKAAVLYFIVAFVSAVAFGYALEKTGGIKYMKNVRIKSASENAEEAVNKRKLPFKEKIKLSFIAAWGSMKPILGYLFIGVGIGAAIYGYLPEDFVVEIAGPDNPLAIPIAAIVGVPLYIRAETAIPIGLALLGKGMSIGAVVALIIGGAGMAIPEMSMLAGIFKRKMVTMIVTVIFLTAVIAGYVFNLFY